MTDGEFTYRRVHDAPRALIFDCMTSPEHLTRFWGPTGTTTPIDGITVELRPGGRFETMMVNDADGSSYTMRAVYVEVRRPDRLVWTERDVEGGVTTTITFHTLDDGRTEVVTHQTNVPPARRAPEAQAGFLTSLDRFEAYLARTRPPKTRSIPMDSGSTMDMVTSADGTAIAFTRAGAGPALVLIDGAMCFSTMGPMGALAARLTEYFTVYTYDRRGRGQSGDTLPYAVEREVEDLEALVALAGGSAFAYAMSSGGALTLRAAAAGVPWLGLALYEPPYTGDKQGYTRELAEHLAAGRRGDAVACFMTLIGTSPRAITGMRGAPMWPFFEAIAPTLAYDDALLGDGSVPRDEAALVKVPTIVLDGGASPDLLRDAAAAMADAIPQARYQTLAGQTHDVDPDALAPVLIDFYRHA